jgi:hypothetical protein
MTHPDPDVTELDDVDIDAELAASERFLSRELAQIVQSPADLCKRTEVDVAEEILSQSPTNTATGLLSVGWATARLLFGEARREDG